MDAIDISVDIIYSRYVEIIHAKEFLPLLEYCWHCKLYLVLVIEEA